MNQIKILLRALLIKWALATLAGSIAALILFSIKEAWGVLLGGLIGIANFSILFRAVYGIINPEAGGGRGALVSLYTIKLVLILFIFFAITKWNLANIVAVLAGFTIILIITAYEGLRQTKSLY